MILRLFAAILVFGVVAAPLAGSTRPPPEGHKLLVISVDGLDWRYLRDRDALGLSIPNLRALLAGGEVADGVVGVWPTITWPSHTSIVTGVRPDQHGVLSNARLGAPVDESYWSVHVLKAPTLYQCAAAHGLSTATITWPTTVDAEVTWNLPEYFFRRNGGSMDLDAVASKATPGLVDAITRETPSFPQQWVDDRTRIVALLYLLKRKQPSLLLVHLVDLDSEAHDRGPFRTNADAVLERTDELIGEVRRTLPPDYHLVITSDHGFERLDRIANLRVTLDKAGVSGDLQPMGGIVTTRDPKVAAFLRGLSRQPDADVGREIPRAELLEYAPKLADAAAAFEPAPHVMFGAATTGPEHTPPREKGEHGFWPLRQDYRSVYLHAGPGVHPRSLGEVQMISLKDRLAAILGLDCR